jgi:hypothetical protein
MCVKSHNSYRDFDTSMGTYIFIKNFIKNNEELFQNNADMHSANTRHKHYKNKHINQLRTSHAFKRAHIMPGSKFSIMCHLISEFLWMEKHDLK